MRVALPEDTSSTAGHETAPAVLHGEPLPCGSPFTRIREAAAMTDRIKGDCVEE